jgi:hypothetical protein
MSFGCLLKGSEEPFFICDLGDVLKKHEEWISALPRVHPHYGESMFN